VATYHPAAILRADTDRAAELKALLEADLRIAAASAPPAPTGASHDA
jgi:hypothetical protein